MTNTSPFVFISYSRKDSDYVESLIKAFKHRGISVWIDTHTDYGATWQSVIEQHLIDCRAFVVVMSPRSRLSHWVTEECQYIMELKKPVFPILLEGNRWFGMGRIQTVDVFDSSLPPERFFDSVSSCIAKGGKSTQVSPVVEPKNIKWVGDWFVNVGEGVHRTWYDCVKYGFIAAGQGSAYIRGLKKLEIGSTNLCLYGRVWLRWGGDGN